jgi:hypothetical protein
VFNWLKQTKPARLPERKPRSVLPIYVTDSDLALCKASTSIRNAYEIRLALFFAVDSKKRFVLNVPIGAQVAPDLRLHIAQHGGIVQEVAIADYSVYIGHFLSSGEEGDGWVIGDAAAHASLGSSLKSHWLRQRLEPGSTVTGTELQQFSAEMQNEVIALNNIDGENIKVALASLVQAAETHGGYLFVQ